MQENAVQLYSHSTHLKQMELIHSLQYFLWVSLGEIAHGPLFQQAELCEEKHGCLCQQPLSIKVPDFYLHSVIFCVCAVSPLGHGKINFYSYIADLMKRINNVTNNGEKDTWLQKAIICVL